MSLEKDDKFYTRDIACAAYLKTKGFPLEVERIGRRGLFYYAKDIQPEVDKFFSGENDYAVFAGNVRSLKSQIQNTRETTNEEFI